MVTLDGTPFTFNGRGEYFILKVSGVDFILQGRMEPLTAQDGSLTRATVYTAFAAKESGSDTVQVCSASERSSFDMSICELANFAASLLSLLK